MTRAVPALVRVRPVRAPRRAVLALSAVLLLGFEAVVERDYPVVMGILVISSLLFLIGNILSDICVALVDPRIRFGE